MLPIDAQAASPRLTSTATASGWRLPCYGGRRWIEARLPERGEAWVRPRDSLLVQPRGYVDSAVAEDVCDYLSGKPWVWPAERLYFFCDLHADADAFVASLVASGGVDKLGPGERELALTEQGRQATFVIGGDCFDKGPRNLPLLRVLRRLIDQGAQVVILAGNHDVRALLGMRCAGNKDPRLAHLFVRMGKKCVPLLRELLDEYAPGRAARASLAREQALHEALSPDDAWFREFPRAAAHLVRPKKIEHELRRIREKIRDFESHCAKHGLSLEQVRTAIDLFHAQFLSPNGEFRWYFERMQLAHRRGSLLFIHGGVDDEVAALLASHGVQGLNDRFRRMLDEEDFFDLYHGPIGNTFRTKYRDTDFPLTDRGLAALHSAGLYAIAHGHRNIPYGQRAIFRCGMLNFECDASVDRNTRALLALDGPGAACTIFQPDGRIMALSTDYPAAKLFDPARHGALLTLV